MTEAIFGVTLGAALGARHALEPDHIAAVSVLTAQAQSARRGFLLGALWGAGHTASLLLVGLIVAALATQVPPAVSNLFELGVAGMLIGMGIRAVVGAMRAGKRKDRRAAHSRAHRHQHVRPLAVGAIHGLAGSGALTALAVARLSTSPARLLFIVVFGAGSTVAMSVVSGVAGWPLGQMARRSVVNRWIAGLTGAVSIGLGLVWGCLSASHFF